MFINRWYYRNVDKSTFGGIMDTNRFLTFHRNFDSILKDIKKKEMLYMSEYGLRSVHVGCLLRIKHSERGMTVTELAKISNTDKALISRVIKELLSDGFVTTKTAGEDNSYRKKYYLTEKSEHIVSDIDEDIGEYMAQARVGISDEDMQKFYETLATLTRNISMLAEGEN